MALTLEEEQDGRVVIVTATGKLAAGDYERFVPAIEAAIQRVGKVRVLFIMQDFHGWDAGALWEDIKFDAKHFSDIERVALVGDKKWEEWMATICKPFTTAKVRYFDMPDLLAAKAWVKADEANQAQAA